MKQLPRRPIANRRRKQRYKDLDPAETRASRVLNHQMLSSSLFGFRRNRLGEQTQPSNHLHQFSNQLSRLRCPQPPIPRIIMIHDLLILFFLLIFFFSPPFWYTTHLHTLGFSHLFLHINWRFEFFFGFKILAAFLIFFTALSKGMGDFAWSRGGHCIGGWGLIIEARHGRKKTVTGLFIM